MAKREEKVVEEGAKTRAIQDLRDWLERVERMGELVRVKEPISCDEEMSAISYLVAKQNPSPQSCSIPSKATKTALIRRDSFGTFSVRAFGASPSLSKNPRIPRLSNSSDVPKTSSATANRRRKYRHRKLAFTRIVSPTIKSI